MFPRIPFWHLIGGALTILLFQFVIFAQSPSITTSEDQQTLIIEGNSDTQVFSFGKNVVVKESAKEVFVFGGDVTIEGKVDGDVGTLGGSVYQKENAYIGGDVIVLGGTYQPEAQKPRRAAQKETVIIGIFEEELRDLAQNPTAVFSPALTWGFLAQRLVSVLFWFLISFFFTTLSPGAVSRAVARFHLSSLKVVGIGFSGFLLTTIGIMLSVAFLPGYLSGLISLMMLVMLFLAYVFGRVALQVSTGKFLQKHILPESKHSETLAILLGVAAWTVVLSVPYIWTFALLLLFSVSIGLVFTARAKTVWQNL
ncbi:MAG TPA: hypothetical protein VIL74_22070 [Pyrinomonadaceae bacterium]|jgi:hypothetical protein